jgi:hypothetical protein
MRREQSMFQVLMTRHVFLGTDVFLGTAVKPVS